MWLDPVARPAGGGFQIIQSFIAVGTGGFTGRGFMQRAAEDRLPARAADRLHLRGHLRGVRPDRRDAGAARLPASSPGAATRIATHDARSLRRVPGARPDHARSRRRRCSTSASCSASCPNKGLPLPFVSAGGSSMLISMLAVGILLNVSQHTAPRLVGGAAADGGRSDARDDARASLRVRDCRRRHRGTPLPWLAIAREILRAPAGRGRDLRRHRARHRGAGGAARAGFDARHDPQPRAQGQVAGGAGQRARHAAARAPSTPGASSRAGARTSSSASAATARVRWSSLAWLRGVPDAAARAERAARPDQSSAGAGRARDRGDLRQTRRAFGDKASSAGTRFAPSSCSVGPEPVGGEEGAHLWRLPGRARDQHGHGGSSVRSWRGRRSRRTITHQTGERDLAVVRDGYRRGPGLAARVGALPPGHGRGDEARRA